MSNEIRGNRKRAGMVSEPRSEYGRIKEPYGYLVGFGYCGWVKELGRFIIFATEQDYLEYIGG